jgi:D-glycero-alpha-D-manno-heptose-7-phosphate kinase
MIESSAPVRICDNGGWTDTWFGGPGRVLNIAVRPGIQVAMRLSAGPGKVLLNLESFGDRYSIVAGARRVTRHALVEAAVDSLPPPGECTTEISIRSGVPAGCGTGTSAAVAVALLGALTRLRSGQAQPDEIAHAAHRLEADVLGSETGVQDHLSAAYGGINYIEVDDYPEAKVVALPVWEALTPLLSLVYLGRPHDSTSVHRQVIETLKQKNSGVLSLLRRAAIAARDAVIAQDLQALGHAMISNTEAQRSLHPAIIGTDAARVIRSASDHAAVGWKVNGAGGDGGSLTILSSTREARSALEDRIARMDHRFRLITVEVSPAGLQVDDSPGD